MNLHVLSDYVALLSILFKTILRYSVIILSVILNTAWLIETVRLCYDKLINLLHASYFKQHNESILNIET